MGRSTEPVSRCFGIDLGRPIDRYYIERFLEAHAADVRGDVLEIADNAYTRQFGGERVRTSHVLSVDPRSANATIVGDLTSSANLPASSMDCVICTQTLQFIFDVRAAVRSLHLLLRPGGVLLATVPGISQIARFDMDNWGEHWRFTTMSLNRLLSESFAAPLVDVKASGNVQAAAAMLYGLPTSDLRPAELDAADPDYELVITARAVKSSVD